MTDRAAVDKKIEAIQSGFSGELGIAAKNTQTGEEVLVNADTVLPTASTIKVGIMVEVYRQEAAGKLELSERIEMSQSDQVGGSGVLKELNPGIQPTIYDLVMLMIIKSDNTATNMLIDRVGGVDAVNRCINDDYGLESFALHNRVDFDRIGDDVRRFAECTPRDMMLMMDKMVRDELVSAEACRQMLDIMTRQQYLDQVPRYMTRNPYSKELKLQQEISVACKTGFYPGTRVDVGAVLNNGESVFTYCVTAHNSSDLHMSAENEAAVVSGLIGRELMRLWWPGDADAVTLSTCYGE
jgi:beta-lactamase class A